jgi:hypothetical protein
LIRKPRHSLDAILFAEITLRHANNVASLRVLYKRKLIVVAVGFREAQAASLWISAAQPK